MRQEPGPGNDVQSLPSFEHPRSRRFEDLGVSPESVLRHAGLPLRLFDQERVLLSTDELFALYRGIEAASQDRAFGLKIGTEERVERYDPIAIAALYARSFRDALQRMARYKQLTCPEELHVTEHENECRVRFEWLLAEGDEPALLTDLCFAWVVEIARRGSASAIQAQRVEFKRPEARGARYCKTHFGCRGRCSALRAQRAGVRSGRFGAALRHPQCRRVGDGRAAARGRVGAAAQPTHLSRAGQGDSEENPRWPATGVAGGCARARA